MSRPPTMVVDASVAVKWHLTDETDADAALLLLRRFGDGELDLIAPDQIRYEVANALAVATRGRSPRLTREHAGEAITEFLGLHLPTVADDEFIREAYLFVHTYDCAF